MALITCPECKTSISDNAINCPKCGYHFAKNEIKRKQENESNKMKNGCIGLVVIIAIVAIVIGISNIGKNDDSKKTETTKKTVAYDKWWEGGNLHNATVGDWKDASYSNKLATAGDWLTVTEWKGHLNSTEDFNKMKEKARILVSAIDKSLLDENTLDNMMVNEIVAILLTLSNDLGPE